MKIHPLSAEDHEVVERYAHQYGRAWKSKLADHWANEWLNQPRMSSDAPVLRSLRNSPNYSFEWLNKYRRPK